MYYGALDCHMHIAYKLNAAGFTDEQKSRFVMLGKQEVNTYSYQ